MAEEVGRVKDRERAACRRSHPGGALAHHCKDSISAASVCSMHQLRAPGEGVLGQPVPTPVAPVALLSKAGVCTCAGDLGTSPMYRLSGGGSSGSRYGHTGVKIAAVAPMVAAVACAAVHVIQTAAWAVMRPGISRPGWPSTSLALLRRRCIS